MDIKQNRPAAAADTKTTITEDQKGQADLSLLSRMAVRTMLEDLETLKKEPGLAAKPEPRAIPVPLPPASLAFSEKSENPSAPSIAPTPLAGVYLPSPEKKPVQPPIGEKERKKEEEEVTKKITQETLKEIKLADKRQKEEVATKIQEESTQDFEKAQRDYAAGAYESTLQLTQKILAAESIPLLFKLKTIWLEKEATNAIHRQQSAQRKEALNASQAPSSPIAVSPVTAQRVVSSPPPNLPVVPDSLDKQEKITSVSKTISPLLTELISGLPSENGEESEGTVFDILKNKRVLFIGASLVLVIVLVGFGWWFANKNVPPVTVSPSGTPSMSASPSVSASPTPSQPAVSPLLVFDKEQIIELKSGGQSLKEKLLTFAETEELAGTLTALTVKDNENKLLSLNELAQSLNLEILSTPTQGCDEATEDCAEPKTVGELLDLTRFSLFFYSQNASSTGVYSPFAVNGKNEGRLGLVISLKEQTGSTSTQSTIDQLKKSLKDLELLLPKELASFLLKPSATPGTQVFLPNYYKNTDIRYLNFPEPDLSIDYAILDDKLIFATSRESTYAIIDRILSQISSPESGFSSPSPTATP